MDKPDDNNHPLDEQLRLRHNVATAVAIIAANRGVQPKDDDNAMIPDLDKIINEVELTYKYTLWKIENYRPDFAAKVINRHRMGIWRD